VVLRTKIMTMKINVCGGIESMLKRPNHTMHNCVMKATTVLLNASITTTAVKERRLRWTTYSNLLEWFQRFWVFLIKYNFTQEESNRELFINNATKHHIININKDRACA
jgi:hypothetical protein